MDRLALMYGGVIVDCIDLSGTVMWRGLTCNPSAPACSIRHNKDTFSTLVIYSVALFVLGLGPFYLISRTSLGALVAATQSGRDTIGALVAVLLTNLVIAAYVYSAFNEPADPRPPSRSQLREAPRKDE